MTKPAARALPMALLFAGCVTETPADGPPDYSELMAPGAGTPQPSASLPVLPGATTAVGAVPWINGVLPYVLPAGISAADTAMLLTACEEWRQAAGITCQPRQNEPTYVTINLYDQSCESGVGSLVQPGIVTLGLGNGCWNYDTILHELGHAIGLEHEHQRTDRDSYLNFHPELVESGFLPNLAVIPGSVMRIGQPYDYFSIMHYSANQGGPTESTLVMMPWDNATHVDIVMGFASRVSEGDAAKVDALYAPYHLQPAGRHLSVINPGAITLVSQQAGKTVVQITGQFLASGNGIAVNWHDTSYNTFDQPATIISESATQIQFAIPTIDSNTVPTNLYPDVTAARMPVWIRVFNAAGRNGSEGIPVPANFPTTAGTVTVGAHLEPAAAPAPPLVFNAASFEQAARLSPGSWATVTGTNLAASVLVGQATGLQFPTTLGGTTVTLTSPAGSVTCPLLYVSQTQINFYVPANAAVGTNQVVVTTNGTTTSTSTIRIYSVSPGLFTATQNGAGWALGQSIWNDAAGTQHVAALSTGSGATAQSIPIDLSAAHGDLYLSIYGTGVRGRSDQRNAFVLIDGLLAPVTFADVQPDFVGVDQINVIAPPALAGRGKVQAYLVVDGVVAPPVQVFFK